MYQYLAGPETAPRFPWDWVNWVWADERFVPHEDPDSNYGMTRAAGLSRAPVPPKNINAVSTAGLSPREAAAAYEHTLKAYRRADKLDAEHPLFDLILLGIGADGHTASLFSDNRALSEKHRWVLAVTGGSPAKARITLTYPRLNNSRELVFIVSGEKKRSIVARVRAGDRKMPAAKIKPVGRVDWFMDRAPALRGAWTQ